MTEPSRQGEVWRIDTVAGRHILAVVLDSAPFVTRSRMVAVAQIRGAFELPENLLLLAVPIADPVEGVISLSDVQVYRRNRFAELLGRIDGDIMARVKTALAARFDLDLDLEHHPDAARHRLSGAAVRVQRGSDECDDGRGLRREGRGGGPG